MSKLKLVTIERPSEDNVPFIMTNVDDNPILAYILEYETIIVYGNNDLVKCSQLERILGKYFIKGTKFIASTYNPTLYYLFPGAYDEQFTPDTNFIPTLKIPELIRDEVNGFEGEIDEESQHFIPTFDQDSSITQDSVKSIKACDSWYNKPEETEAAENAINERIDKLFKYYNGGIDVEKEVHSNLGGYSADLSSYPIVVSLLSKTTYTDTINLEDWIIESGKGTNEISGKLDISFQYSIEGKIHGGMQTINAFRYSNGNALVNDCIINLGEVQIEYIRGVLKIYPINVEIDEVIINDCVLTIGIL